MSEESSVKELMSYGWSEEKSREFLRSKVVYKSIHVPAFSLPNVLAEVSKEGLCMGDKVTLIFAVPEGRAQEFDQAAERGIAKQGGFLLTEREALALQGSGGGKLN